MVDCWRRYAPPSPVTSRDARTKTPACHATHVCHSAPPAPCIAAGVSALAIARRPPRCQAGAEWAVSYFAVYIWYCRRTERCCTVFLRRDMTMTTAMGVLVRGKAGDGWCRVRCIWLGRLVSERDGMARFRGASRQEDGWMVWVGWVLPICPSQRR
jgi:hypothetical protein